MVFLGARTLGAPIWTSTCLSGVTLSEVIRNRDIDAYYVDPRGFGFASFVDEMRASRIEEVTQRYSIDKLEADIENAVEFIVSSVGQAVPLVSYSFTTIPAARLMIRRPELFSAGLMIAPHWPHSANRGHPHLAKEIARLEEMPHFRFLVSDIVTRINAGNRTGTPLLHPEFATHFGEVLRNCQPDTYRVSDNSWIAPVGHVIDAYRAIYDGHPYFLPEALQTPVMVVCSRDDIECPPEMSQRIAQSLRCRNRLLLCSGVTHFWLFESRRVSFLQGILDAYEKFVSGVES